MTESLEATFIGGPKDGDVQILPGDSYPSTIEIKSRTSVGGKSEALPVTTYHLVPGEVMTGIYVEDLSDWDVSTISKSYSSAGFEETADGSKFLIAILVFALEESGTDPRSTCIGSYTEETTRGPMRKCTVQGIRRKSAVHEGRDEEAT